MIAIFDGAMGTMLQNAGLAVGACPEAMNLEAPDVVTSIHRQYIEHGATIIETNTFGANRIKLTHYGLQNQISIICQEAVNAAKAACRPETRIAGSIGPTGKLLHPLGDLSFDEAYDVFCEQIRALDAAGVDLLLIETIIDIQEMRAALLAAKDSSSKPVICQLSFGADGRTVTGTDPETAAILLTAMGADVLGANCSLGPEQLLPVVEKLARATHLPLSVQPNAGMPHLVNGETVFPMSPEEMAHWAPKLVAAGASYLGGCCGTTPAHIRALSQAAASLSPVERNKPTPGRVALTSRSRTVWLGADLPAAVIGERINPTGRKALAAEIREGSFAMVKRDALAQVKAGAQVLDVNMGVAGIDQAPVMKRAIEELSMLVDLPLAIDTSDTAALEAGLKQYPGRALINSVSAEPERLEQFLPLAKRYGAAILCLPISPSGVPATAPERVAVIRQILAAAQAQGLTENDFILDALTLTVAAEADAALQTLATLRSYREEFGYPSTMGLSNISFGLPARDAVNTSFAAMAFAAGLDAPILNPLHQGMMQTAAASMALTGRDSNGRRYSQAFAQAQQPSAAAPAAATTPADILGRLRQAVIEGEKEAVPALVEEALTQGRSSLEITDQGLTAAMTELGEAFGAGRCFLPQVLLSAETMRQAFITLKDRLPGEATLSLGKVVLATVKGDIHDLGKNIVAALLENNGFTVIDLGKDVPIEAIVAAVKEQQADAVGLCALMTTTLPVIDATISALRQAGLQVPVIAGGAVVTADYAAQAGAQAYAPDGVAAVQLAKKLMG